MLYGSGRLYHFYPGFTPSPVHFSAGSYNACPVKAECTDSAHGRTILRPFLAEYLDLVRAYHETPAYEKAMRKRQVWVEPLFCEAKDWHGLRRFRLRGLDNANIEGLMVAAGQNLKRLLKKWGWGRRPWPTGGTGWPSPAPFAPPSRA
jgi:Transposase DDE domain